jgi:heme-degrading monooxygenase HmoA
LQSAEDPRQFNSFAYWKNADDLRAGRREPQVEKALQRAADLCEESQIGAYELAEEFYQEEIAEVSLETEA